MYKQFDLEEGKIMEREKTGCGLEEAVCAIHIFWPAV